MSAPPPFPVIVRLFGRAYRVTAGPDGKYTVEQVPMSAALEKDDG